jgi:superfamily II RNA helicase
MLNLSTQTIDKQDFSIFLRDLSTSLNVNLKHMIEDTIKIEDTNKNNKKNYHKSKKKIVKKKDLIIQQQKEKKKKENYENDIKKIDFLLKKTDVNVLFESINHLKTEEGKTVFKTKLLDYFWEKKNKYMNYVFLLYFNLKDKVKNEKIEKIQTVLSDYDCKSFMMKNMGQMLPPLDYWNQTEKRFEEWQLKTIKHIYNNESIIVKAPTSSGKSFIAMSSGIFHKKILYVCPAKPVVYQVGAHFTYMGYKVHFLVDNVSGYSYDSKTNIFIGTPEEIENNFLKIGVNFDYAVFDEIHNIDKKEDGDIYENIIKLLDCNFLALSATIKNIDFLKDIFLKLHPNKKINYVEYNKRFINQQRWIWNNNGYNKIHPFCSFENVNDLNITNNLPFTPNDCVELWECMDDIFEDIIDDFDENSPEEFFQEEKLLTLDDCRLYEKHLKEVCIQLSKTYPKLVQKIFNNFPIIKNKSHDNSNMIDFIKQSKKKDLFPMLMFHTEEKECKSIFENIFDSLDKQELQEYPFHYDILEKKQHLYEEYLSKRETYKSNIKVSQSTNPEYFIKDKMETFDRKEKDVFIQNINNYYLTKVGDLEKRYDEIKDEVIQKQITNLKREMNTFLQNPDFCYQDVFQKHKDFIFTRSNKPMDSDTIRNVRREIKKTLGIKIDYESSLFQMLKRGIGIYIDNMPDEYNWILQKLLSEKEIGIVISDRTLCLGIDLPVRSSCFLGINNNFFTNDEYLQMSGRAGRRGKDTQGNVIFYGDIDYIKLMKGDLPEIKGNTTSISNFYDVIDSSEKLYQNMINQDRVFQKIDGITINDKNKKLLWSMRRYPKSQFFLNELNKLEKKIYQEKEYNRETYLLEKINEITDYDIIKLYKSKRIENYDEVNKCKEYINILMYIHNNLNYQQYMITLKCVREIFSNINRMMFNYIL